MKTKTAIIALAFAFLFVVAHGDDTDVVNWAGNWDQKSTSSETACYPDSTVLISQSIGKITASWIWANTQPCIQAGLAKKQFTETADTPKDNSIPIKITVAGGEIDGTFTITGDTAIFASNNGASASYDRRQQLVNWPGVWDVITQDETACNPDGSITVTQSGSYVSASWTWANSAPCTAAGLERVEEKLQYHHDINVVY